MSSNARFTLTPIEREQALWKKIEAHLSTRLQVMREKNDGQLTEQETAKLRGSIAFCKEVLSWGQVTPNIPSD